MVTATANTYKTYLNGDALATYTGGGVWAQMYVTRSSTTTETTFELWGYAYFKWINGWTNVDMALSGTDKPTTRASGSMTGYGNSEGRSPTRNLYAKWSYPRESDDIYKTFIMSITLSGGYGDSKVQMTCTVPKLEYTACGAPTSVTISPSLIAPTSTATLSWSGATAGTSNAIAGYNVYRSTSVDGTYNKLNSSKITTTSFVVDPNGTRGSSYYYKVQTIGTVSGYDSAQSSKYASVKTNSLPSAPTVTVNKTIVPSTGGSVTFTVTAGATNDTGQTASLYYAVNNGTKTSFTSPLTLTVSATTTYNFYTYDGLEYSSATAKSITKNTAPVINTFSGTNTTYTANETSTWVKSISSSFTLSKNSGTLSCNLYYSTTSSGTYTKVNVFNGVSITSTSYTRTLNINDILKSIYSQQRLYYYLDAVFNDGVENSATKRYPSSGTYSLSPPPTLNSRYNQFSTSNISGTTSGHFYNKIRQYFNYDSDISACTVSAKYKSSGTSITCTSSLTNGSGTNGAYIDITLPNNITGDSIVSFTLSFSNGSFNKTATFEATQVKDINFGNVQQSGVNPIKVYSSTTIYTIVSQWPFGTSDLAAAKTTYEFSADPVVQIFYGNNKINLTYTSFEKSGSNLVITLDATTVSNSILSSFTTLFGSSATKSGIKECSYKLSWTNLYSKVFTSSAIPINVSFEEDPTFTTVYPQYSLNGSSSWTALTSSSYLQEGLYIRPRITIQYFTQETITGQFMYSIDGGTTFNRWSDISQNVNGTTTRTRGSVTVTGASKQLPEITSTSDWVFKVVLNKNNVSSGNVTCKAIKHISANIEITSLTYNSSGQTITAAINVRDIGYASSLGSADSGTGTAPKVINSGTSSAFVNLSGTTLASTSTVIKYNTTSCTGSYNMGSTASLSIQIKYISQIQGYTTITKTSYSTIAVLYNMMPTVAYRKNQLGINTTAVTSDSVLDIYSSTGKNKIILHFTQKNGTISLSDGTLTNFIVGGGTWTGTTAAATSTINQLVIKKGAAAPTTNNLTSYEVGYATNTQTLYINDNGTIRPIGNSSIAQMALTGSYTLNELTAGNLVVTGNASFTNNIQANTINGVTVGSNPKFTDNNTTYSAGTGLSLSSTTFSLATSGATAGSYGPSANASPAHSGTFKVPYITVDTYGRVTAASTKTITLPASGNTDTKVTITAVNPTSETLYYPLMYTDTEGTTEVNAYDYLRHWIKKGTADSAGYDYLGIGNNVGTGTVNNSYGTLRLYGNGTKYAQIRYDSEANATANTTHYLPKTGGTLLNTGTVADYVVEEGTWGSHGKYIKWNSGIAECFGWDSTTTAINSTYGNAGIAYKALTVTFPSIFTASPCTDITLQRNGGLIWPSIYSLSTTSVSFYIGSATTESSATIYFHVIAKGFWK